MYGLRWQPLWTDFDTTVFFVLFLTIIIIILLYWECVSVDLLRTKRPPPSSPTSLLKRTTHKVPPSPRIDRVFYYTYKVFNVIKGDLPGDHLLQLPAKIFDSAHGIPIRCTLYAISNRHYRIILGKWPSQLAGVNSQYTRRAFILI